MGTIYTLKDIQTLLAQKYPKLKWNYEIYERRFGEKVQASIETFNENMLDTLTLACIYNRDNEIPLKVSISDFSFLVYEDEPNILESGSTTRLKADFTNAWMSLLLAEHGHEYAKKLISYCKRCKEEINRNATQEIKKYVLKINARVEHESLPYEKLIQKANSALASSDFAEEK